jgi:hypothetical protein
MTQRKKTPDCDRAFALLHELARDVIDCGDMVRIHGVTQPKPVCEQGRPQQHGMAMKSD